MSKNVGTKWAILYFIQHIALPSSRNMHLVGTTGGIGHARLRKSGTGWISNESESALGLPF